MTYTCAVDKHPVFEQQQLPKEYWDWRAKTPPSTTDAMAHVLAPMQPGRRVFAIHDGDGEGDGVPCGQLSLIPS